MLFLRTERHLESIRSRFGYLGVIRRGRTRPCDVMSREPPILVPHADYGDPECCGIIMPARAGQYVDLKGFPGTADVELTCNECGAVIGIVPVAEAEATLLRMAMDGGLCTQVCPHCGETNVLLGFTSVEAFTCRYCGTGVIVRLPVQ